MLVHQLFVTFISSGYGVLKRSRSSTTVRSLGGCKLLRDGHIGRYQPASIDRRVEHHRLAARVVVTILVGLSSHCDLGQIPASKNVIVSGVEIAARMAVAVSWGRDSVHIAPLRFTLVRAARDHNDYESPPPDTLPLHSWSGPGSVWALRRIRWKYEDFHRHNPIVGSLGDQSRLA